MTAALPAPAPDEARRRTVRRCLLLMGILSAGTFAGAAASLYLVNHHPLLLVALSPLGRHLVLAAHQVDPSAFVAVVVVRRLLFYLPCFRLGETLGGAAIEWIEARAAYAGRLVRWIERLFARAPHAVVLLLPDPSVSTLAGISGMPLPRFTALAVAGLALRALIVLRFARWLRGPLSALLELIDRYWIPGTALLVTAIALAQWRRRALAAARQRT